MNEKQVLGSVVVVSGAAIAFYSESSERRYEVEKKLGFYGPQEELEEKAKQVVVLGDIALRAGSVAACLLGLYLIFKG